MSTSTTTVKRSRSKSPAGAKRKRSRSRSPTRKERFEYELNHLKAGGIQYAYKLLLKRAKEIKVELQEVPIVPPPTMTELVKTCDIEICKSVVEIGQKRILSNAAKQNREKFGNCFPRTLIPPLSPVSHSHDLLKTELDQRVRIQMKGGAFRLGTVTNFYNGRKSMNVQVLIDGRGRAQAVGAQYVFPIP